MDFGSLLQTAKQNGSNKPKIQYYPSKFAPPKKLERNKTPSVNIQKFLAKKEAEEKQRLEEERMRKEKLLELRAQDKKATRRVKVMLNRTKSANQSAIDDAVDRNNTEVTLAGDAQPDEDDYGFVSQESTARFYEFSKKYSHVSDEPKYERRKVSTNLNSTKEKMKAALYRDIEEANNPHRRKRKHADGAKLDIKVDKEVNLSPEYEEEKPKAKPKPPPPPAFKYEDLLKIAAKKQHEPIIIEPKKVEEEKLLTKKQKLEMQKEKESRERRERESQARNKEAEGKPAKIPKLSDQNKPRSDVKTDKNMNIPIKTDKNLKGEVPKREIKKVEIAKEKVKTEPKRPDANNQLMRKQPQLNYKPSQLNNKPNLTPEKSMNDKILSNGKHLTNGKPSLSLPNNKVLPNKEFPPRDLQTKSKLQPTRSKEFPPRDMKPKQFPPSDVRRKENRNRPVKNRIYDDDEEEYDSEMDDFIDDDPIEGENEMVSRMISQIFNYDKKRYRDVDEDDIDNMESTFAQQMKEEVISTKIGIKEDLEDIKREEEEKKRKMKKKKM